MKLPLLSDLFRGRLKNEGEAQTLFYTSSFCASGECVAVARGTDGTVKVRDTKQTRTQALSFTEEEWLAFLQGVKNGEFDV
jgi:hypothetical protein